MIGSIIDADTLNAASGIRARAEDIQRTLFLDRDDELDEQEDVIECD
jgi:hypothetical protein